MSDRTSGFGTATTDEVLAGLDLSDKHVLITGGSSGLGAESARALSTQGAQVVITVRNEEKGWQIAKQIEEVSGKTIRYLLLDLGAIDSIRRCADQITRQIEQLDVVLLNAGIMACDQGVTADQFERQFGVNHLGHFLLANLILPKVLDGGRIVCLSSSAHQISPVIFDDIMFKQREYDRWVAYGQSKSANALFVAELQKRIADRAIDVFAVHPGAIMTELGRHLPDEEMADFQQRIDSGQLVLKSIPEGAATQVFAATAPELQGKGGNYLADCQICDIDDETKSMNVVRSYAVDPDLARRLWAESEALVGQDFLR